MTFIFLIFGISLAILSTRNAWKILADRFVWGVCAFLLWSGLICVVIGEAGVTMDETGLLHEVGFVLPLGAFLLLFGMGGGVILALRHGVCWIRSHWK